MSRGDAPEPPSHRPSSGFVEFPDDDPPDPAPTPQSDAPEPVEAGPVAGEPDVSAPPAEPEADVSAEPSFLTVPPEEAEAEVPAEPAFVTVPPDAPALSGAARAGEQEPPVLEIRELEAIVTGQNLHKQYGSGPAAVHALNGVSISLYPGSFTAIMGPSGSGKSTLMHLLAGLDTPTSGEVWIGPTRLGELGETDRTRLRRSRVGFVFQSFNLLPTLTLEQNITLPQRIAGRRVDQAWLEWLLVAIGLQDRRRARPAELSGGEQQRVSLARALLAKPNVVFADEPTGNLDSRATEVILTMLRRAVEDLNQTIVIVTHDHQAAARADRIVFLEDGRIVREA